MSRVIVSTKRVYMIWKCPANLLPVEDNSKTEFGEPWTWELFRDTLTYYDQNKVKHEVNVTVENEPDYKHHEDVDIDWPENWCMESDEEEESESPP
jgi:hypothetical protein